MASTLYRAEYASPDWLLKQGGVEEMRTIGLDVHKRFAEAVILEPGQPLRRRRSWLAADEWLELIPRARWWPGRES